MSQSVKCPLCGSSEVCNVYAAKTYEYISVSKENEIDYSYSDEVEDFLHSECDECGAIFAKKIETFVRDE